MPPIFSNEAEGLYGVGFGFTVDKLGFGYSDNRFWYFGECSVFPVPALPGSVTKVDSLWFPSLGAWGFNYYNAPNSRYYLAESNGAGPFWRVLPYNELQTQLDRWRADKFAGFAPKTDLSRCGFLYLGLEWWKQNLYLAFPPEFFEAMQDPYANLPKILKYLPKTGRAAPMTGNTGNADVSVDLSRLNQSAQARGGQMDLLTLLALSRLGQTSKKTKKRKRGR
jgi:hypothetical protein